MTQQEFDDHRLKDIVRLSAFIFIPGMLSPILANMLFQSDKGALVASIVGSIGGTAGHFITRRNVNRRD